MNDLIYQLPKELIEERIFEFNKVGVPEELKDLLAEIEHNKRKWKSLYMGVWGYSFQVLDIEIKEGRGDVVRVLGLPASKYKCTLYTPNELKGYLTDYDRDIHANQVFKIFTLLENYLFKYYQLTEKPELRKQPSQPLRFGWIPKFIRSRFNKGSINFTYFWQMKKYLKNKGFASDAELNELKLAKETRNCFIHFGGMIDKKWLIAYKKTFRRGKHNLNDKIKTPFSDLEDWTDIFIKIVSSSLKQFNSQK